MKSIFDKAMQTGGKTASKKEKTKRGLKDTFQDFFTEKLFKSQKGKTGEVAEAALDSAIHRLPAVTDSPVWRIKGKILFQLSPTACLFI